MNLCILATVLYLSFDNRFKNWADCAEAIAEQIIMQAVNLYDLWYWYRQTASSHLKSYLCEVLGHI